MYYYRTNYLLLATCLIVIMLISRPLALFAMLVTILGLLCLNDPFALAFNNVIVKAVRRVHPPTAHALKNYESVHTALAGSRRKTPNYKIAGLPRHLFITVLDVLALYLLWHSGTLLKLFWVLPLALGLPLAHASLRAPNLKARPAGRQEFAATWRGYQTHHDYTL